MGKTANQNDLDALRAEVERLRKQVADYEARESSPERQHVQNAGLILDGMYQFAALLDAEGRLVDVNQVALDEGGVKREEVIGKLVWETPWLQVSPEVVEICHRDVLTAAGGQFVRHELDVFGAEAGAEIINIDWSLNPIHDEEGRLWIVAEGRNITEKKLAEAEVARKTEELRRAHEQLKEMDRIKSEFFANVSHELRTPLSLILGPVRRMLADERLGGRRREELAVVERNAGMLLKQVNNLLDLARIDAQGMQLRYTHTDLAELVRIVGSYFELLAGERGVDYRVEASGQIPADIDPDKIHRVLLNLLSNAFKFTPEEGTIHCSLEQNGDEAVIVVEDSGPGIPDDHRVIAFERFRQIEGSATRKVGGTGLGLAIAREFVQLHGGAIEILDGETGGARIEVRLPLRAPEEAEVTTEKTQFDADEGKQTTDELRSYRPPVASEDSVKPIELDNRPLVLVVEDNPDMNHFIAQALKETFRVANAFNGRDGLEMACLLRPDAIVSDIMMPHMSGDQMIAELRSDPDLSEIPVIVLTAKADDSQRVRLLEQHVQDHVTKPFQADELLARVGVLVNRRRETIRKLREMNASLEERVTERTAKIERQSEQLRKLVSQLNTAEQKERRRLAEALHDGLQQTLVAVQFHMQSAMDRIHAGGSDEEISDVLKYAAKLLQEAGKESRWLAKQLFPPILYDRGLVPALDWLARNFEETHNLRVSVELDPTAETPDSSLRAFLFEATRELLLNVIKHAKTPEATVELKRRASKVSICVADQGVGFAADTDVQARDGGGMGLFGIRERLLAIGGNIRVESAVGNGCRVEIRCPLHGADRARSGAGEAPEQAEDDGEQASRSIRVMIVEDHKLMREGLRKLLKEVDGISVVGEAQDGVDMINRIEEADPDVVLMDVSMPKMDGIEATRWIRRRKPEIRVIGLSMYAQEEMAETMREAGAEQYLTKGGPAEMLIDAICRSGAAV